LGGLSFLTFLGVLLYQLATSARSLNVVDLDTPLDLSDVADTPLDDFDDVSGEATPAGDRIELLADVFNGLWRVHKSKSAACMQRFLCRTLIDPSSATHPSNDPLTHLAVYVALVQLRH
jgi:hypothetical protein